MINLFLNWLTASVPISQLWLYIIGAIILTFVWDYIVTGITNILGICHFVDGRISKITPFYLIKLFFLALVEEVTFRFPLAILVLIGLKLPPILILAAIFSLVFAATHGKLINLLMQGGDGFIWCLFFLK